MRWWAWLAFLLAGTLFFAAGGWLGALSVSDGSRQLNCLILKPVTKFTDLQQQYYNEQCRQVWARFTMPVTEPANLLRFELEFTGEEGADGIFTVSIDGEVVGTIRQAEAEGPGMHDYIFAIPEQEPGTFELEFRLVPINDKKAGIQLGEARLGYKRSSELPSSYIPAERLEADAKAAEFAIKKEESVSEGLVSLESDTVVLDTVDGPAWVTIPITTVATGISLLHFDVDFTSPAEAEGLAAFYLDNEVLATYDERFNDESLTDEIIPLVAEPGFHTLSMRLDAHTDARSSVRISNMRTELYQDATADLE